MRRDYVRTTDVHMRLGDVKPVDPLARDVDGDGQISGGGELFGPRISNGFAELGSAWRRNSTIRTPEPGF